MAGKVISVKIEGTADLAAVTRSFKSLFAATQSEAKAAADKVEGQFERAAEAARSSARKISDAFVGANDSMSNLGGGFDARRVAARIEAAFGRLAELSGQLDTAGLQRAASRVGDLLLDVGISSEDVKDHFRQAGDEGRRLAATWEGVNTAGTQMRGVLEQLGGAMQLAEIKDRNVERTESAVARMRSALQTLPPEAQVMVRRVAAEMERLAERGPDETVRAMDQVRAAIRTLPPEMASAANRMLGDMQRAAQQTPDLWDRSNVKIANDLRELGGRLPRQLVGVAAQIANQLDPRPYTERKYDDLQDELARVAKSLPPEFQSAARRIQGELSAAAKKIPPPFVDAKGRVASDFKELPKEAKKAGDDVVDKFQSSARRSESAFDGMGRRIGSKFGEIGRIAAGNLIAELTTAISSKVISPALQFAAEAPSVAFDAQKARNSLRSQLSPFLQSEAERFSREEAPTFGVSPVVARDALAQFTTQGIQLGLAEAEAFKRAKEKVRIVGLFQTAAGDTSPERSVDAIAATSRGEYDAAQRFLPLLSARLIEERALLNTGKKKKDALTALDKENALHNILTEGATVLQKAQNTAVDEAFFKMLQYDAGLKKAQEDLGTKMIPATLAFKKAQLDLTNFMVYRAVPAIQRWQEQFRIKYAHQILDVKEAAKDFFDGLRQGFTAGDVSKWQTAGVTVRSFFESLFTGKTQNEEATQVERFGLAIRNGFEWLVDHKDEIVEASKLVIDKLIQFGPAGLAAFGAFRLLSKAAPGLSTLTSVLPKLATGLPALLGSAAGGPITVGVILTAATIGGLVLAYQHSERFRDAVNTAKDNVVEALPEFDKLKSAFNIDGEGGKSALGAGESTLVLFATLLERITASIGPMASAVSTAAPVLSLLTGPLQVAEPFFKTFSGTLDTLTALMNGDFSAAWQNFKTLVPNAIELVIRSVTPGIPWNSLLSGLDSVVDSILSKINRVIEGANKLPGVNISPIAQGSKQAGKVAKPTRAATGHVAFNEQMLIVGDNRGARTDPELISPKSHIASAVRDGVSEALARMQAGPSGPRVNIEKVMVPEGRDLWQEIALMERVYAQV